MRSDAMLVARDLLHRHLSTWMCSAKAGAEQLVNAHLPCPLAAWQVKELSSGMGSTARLAQPAEPAAAPDVAAPH